MTDGLLAHIVRCWRRMLYRRRWHHGDHCLGISLSYPPHLEMPGDDR